MNKYKTLVATLALVGCAFTSQAAVFFGEDLDPVTSTDNSAAANAQFLANLSGTGTENFEGFALGTASPLIVDFGVAGTATLSGLGNVAVDSGFGRFGVSGTQFWETNESFSITFSSAISAFGFYGTDIGDIGGQLTLETDGTPPISFTVANTVNAPDGSLLFWGVIDTANPFTKITFGNTNSSDFFGFDDLTIGVASQVVPATSPTSLLMMGLAAFGLVLAKRRKV